MSIFRDYLFLFLASLVLLSCNSEPVHPLYGKWKVAYINDSLVIDNPDEIFMIFTEEGKVTSVYPEGQSEGTYVISDDTSQITIMEGGKPAGELLIHSLTGEMLVIKEGPDLVKFKKITE